MEEKTGLVTKQHKIINLKHLAAKTGIDYMLLYNNIKGAYKSLDANQKTMLCNVLYDELTEVGKFLGFEVKIKKIR